MALSTDGGRGLSPRVRLVLWWVLLAAVGLVALLALRPDSDDVGDVGDVGDGPASVSDTTGATGTTGSTVGNEARTGASSPPEAVTDTVPATTPTASTPGDPTDPGGAPTDEQAFDGQEPDDTSPNTATTLPVDENGCLPGYAGACIPPAPPVLTCADIAERGILVTGPDPHGLDDDYDGTACPSELPPATTAPGTPPDPID